MSRPMVARCLVAVCWRVLQRWEHHDSQLMEEVSFVHQRNGRRQVETKEEVDMLWIADDSGTQLRDTGTLRSSLDTVADREAEGHFHLGTKIVGDHRYTVSQVGAQVLDSPRTFHAHSLETSLPYMIAIRSSCCQCTALTI